MKITNLPLKKYINELIIINQELSSLLSNDYNNVLDTILPTNDIKKIKNDLIINEPFKKTNKKKYVEDFIKLFIKCIICITLTNNNLIDYTIILNELDSDLQIKITENVNTIIKKIEPSTTVPGAGSSSSFAKLRSALASYGRKSKARSSSTSAPSAPSAIVTTTTSSPISGATTTTAPSAPSASAGSSGRRLTKIVQSVTNIIKNEEMNPLYLDTKNISKVGSVSSPSSFITLDLNVIDFRELNDNQWEFKLQPNDRMTSIKITINPENYMYSYRILPRFQIGQFIKQLNSSPEEIINAIYHELEFKFLINRSLISTRRLFLFDENNNIWNEYDTIEDYLNSISSSSNNNNSSSNNNNNNSSSNNNNNNSSSNNNNNYTKDQNFDYIEIIVGNCSGSSNYIDNVRWAFGDVQSNDENYDKISDYIESFYDSYKKSIDDITNNLSISNDSTLCEIEDEARKNNLTNFKSSQDKGWLVHNLNVIKSRYGNSVPSKSKTSSASGSFLFPPVSTKKVINTKGFGWIQENEIIGLNINEISKYSFKIFIKDSLIIDEYTSLSPTSLKISFKGIKQKSIIIDPKHYTYKDGKIRPFFKSSQSIIEKNSSSPIKISNVAYNSPAREYVINNQLKIGQYKLYIFDDSTNTWIEYDTIEEYMASVSTAGSGSNDVYNFMFDDLLIKDEEEISGGQNKLVLKHKSNGKEISILIGDKDNYAYNNSDIVKTLRPKFKIDQKIQKKNERAVEINDGVYDKINKEFLFNNTIKVLPSELYIFDDSTNTWIEYDTIEEYMASVSTSGSGSNDVYNFMFDDLLIKDEEEISGGQNKLVLKHKSNGKEISILIGDKDNYAYNNSDIVKTLRPKFKIDQKIQKKNERAVEINDGVYDKINKEFLFNNTIKVLPSELYIFDDSTNTWIEYDTIEEYMASVSTSGSGSSSAMNGKFKFMIDNLVLEKIELENGDKNRLHLLNNKTGYRTSIITDVYKYGPLDNLPNISRPVFTSGQKFQKKNDKPIVIKNVTVNDVTNEVLLNDNTIKVLLSELYIFDELTDTWIEYDTIEQYVAGKSNTSGAVSNTPGSPGKSNTSGAVSNTPGSPGKSNTSGAVDKSNTSGAVGNTSGAVDKSNTSGAVDKSNTSGAVGNTSSAAGNKEPPYATRADDTANIAKFFMDAKTKMKSNNNWSMDAKTRMKSNNNWSIVLEKSPNTTIEIKPTKYYITDLGILRPLIEVRDNIITPGGNTEIVSQSTLNEKGIISVVTDKGTNIEIQRVDMYYFNINNKTWVKLKDINDINNLSKSANQKYLKYNQKYLKYKQKYLNLKNNKY